MKDATFKVLETKLEGMLSSYKVFNPAIEKGIDNLTVKEARDFKSMACARISQMDQLITTDMYHIIGMGNLSASQLSHFMKLVADILYYRPIMKSLSCGTFSETNYKKTNYNCKSLGIALNKENY